MSAEKLLQTRAEILAVSDASATQPMDRAAADQAICSAVRRHGGVRGCLATLAHEYGDHPETASARMRWARQTVAALYRAGAVPAAHPGTAAAAGSVRPARLAVATLTGRMQRRQVPAAGTPTPSRTARRAA